MMLSDKFFTIESLPAKSDSGTIQVNIFADHEVFSGHFPDRPIVPGVFTLQMIKECIEKLLNKVLRYSEISNCKFTNIILPKEITTLFLDYNLAQNEGIRLNTTVRSEDKIYMTLKAIMTEIPESIQ